MKKIVLFILLLAVVATSASAVPSHFTRPQFGKLYYCEYYNFSGDAKNPGYSWWEYRGEADNIIWSFEHFQRTNGQWDAYKAAWAKPVLINYYGKTQWEFTFYNGPQCKNTVVYPGGSPITFNDCTDGHSRTCWVK